jgi:tetratricopeptide (TPR) repeat protein
VKRRSSYKITFFDRHGPAAELQLKAAGLAIMVFGFSLMMFGVLGMEKLGLTGWPLILFTLVGALTLSSAAAFVGLKLGAGAGKVAEHVYMGGSNTPYEEQFSQEQALVMQRDYATALALFEQRIINAPDEPRVRIAAADLYRTYGENPQRAAELYREVQRIPEIMSGHDIYVSNKLADLYLGPLKAYGRALVEFRRLIERYPGSVAADHARMALVNLKEDMLKEHMES